jgi:protein-disulfide isomerase
MSNSSNMTKVQRREAARAEALALKQKQAARDRRNRTITLSALGVAVLALAGVFVFVLMQGNERSARFDFDDVPLAEVTQAPQTAQDDGGIPVGTDGAAGTTTDGAPTVGVYFDYMCPICGQFEDANGQNVDDMIKNGDATVTFHPVAILDRASAGSNYSTRSAAAAAWVADKAPEQFLAFHEAMFAQQPEENTEGLTDQEIADIAVQAGVPQAVADGISDGTAVDTYGQWVYSASQGATDDKDLYNPQSNAFGTPTLTLDGKRWDGNWTDPSALTTAVAQAAGK